MIAELKKNTQAESAAIATCLAKAEETIEELTRVGQHSKTEASAKKVCPLTASTAVASSLHTNVQALDSSTAHTPEGAGLTYSRPRLNTQRAAVEYRRAVREYLQSSSCEDSQAITRSCLHGLYRTPREMLDDEVLSEDEGESDLCTTRKKIWFHNLSLRSACDLYI